MPACRSAFSWPEIFLERLSLVIFLSLQLLTYASADGKVSIASFTSYSVQRYCVRECLWEGRTDGGPPLPGYLTCAQPYSDSCICRTDLAATASSFLSSCVNTYCSSNTVDISNAIGLYNGYCAGNLAVVTSAGIVTIESSNAYSTVRRCVQDCIWAGDPAGGLAVAGHLGCFGGNIYNDCMCRADLSGTAATFLTSCANKWCTGNTADIGDAVSLFTAYCNAALATTTAGAVPSSPSQNASPSQTTSK